MGKKAVYNQQYLAIYITREDFDAMLDWVDIGVPVFIGKGKTSLGLLRVQLTQPVRNGLKYALEQELLAYEKVRQDFRRAHPNYESSIDTQRRQQRARKRLQRRSHDAD